ASGVSRPLHPRQLATFFVITGLHPIAGQTPVTHVLRGVVSSLQGAPVSGASVFLLESMDAAPSGADGRFALRTTAQGRVTVVARHIGFAPSNLVVPADTTAEISLVLRPQAAVLVPVTVQAGAYTACHVRA